MKRISVAIAFGCLFAAVGGSSPSVLRANGHLSEPPPLSVKRGDAVVSASLGTYCWNHPVSAAICADAGYPLAIHKRLAVAAGDRLVLRLGTSAAQVNVSLHKVASEPPRHHTAEHDQLLARLSSRPISPSRGRWATRLPRKLKGGNILDVSVEYANGQGDADFWVGLRPS
jgi:hypothetical protein